MPLAFVKTPSFAMFWLERTPLSIRYINSAGQEPGEHLWKSACKTRWKWSYIVALLTMSLATLCWSLWQLELETTIAARTGVSGCCRS